GIVALHNRSAHNGTAMSGTESSSTSQTTDTSAASPVAAPSAPAAPTPSEGTQAGGAQMTTAGGASFSVPSPQDAGASVAVADLSLSQPTWIIVSDSNNGQPGRILGATLLFPADKT